MVTQCVNIRGSWVKGIRELSAILLQLFCEFKTSLEKKCFALKRRRGIKDGWKECEAESSKLAIVMKTVCSKSLPSAKCSVEMPSCSVHSYTVRKCCCFCSCYSTFADEKKETRMRLITIPT